MLLPPFDFIMADTVAPCGCRNISMTSAYLEWVRWFGEVELFAWAGLRGFFVLAVFFALRIDLLLAILNFSF